MSESTHGNQPTFDPINPTPEQDADMVAGYLAAGDRDAVKPPFASVAFEHGWRMRRNDIANVSDADQWVNAERYVAKLRGQPDPFPPTPGPEGNAETGRTP